MSNALTGAIERVRRPEYTGENRCLPCTAVNVLFAGAVAVVLAVLWWPAAAAWAAVAVAAIALRGYLVPGTPTLTKRYFPPWLLSLFGKGETVAVGEGSVAESGEWLAAAGVIGECPDVDDLCLADGFRRAWRERIDGAREDESTQRSLAAAFLETPVEEVTFRDHGRMFVVDGGDGERAQWRSRAAFLADVTGAAVLAEQVPAWGGRSKAEQARTLAALRVFLEACPACGGAVEAGEETVETCCTTREVVNVRCADCEALFLEGLQS